MYIEKLEKQKKDLRDDPNYSSYAYVTHQDLVHLNFNSKQPKHNGNAPQQCIFAIRTPHGSKCDVDSSQEVLDSNNKLPRKRYHLIIDAENAEVEEE